MNIVADASALLAILLDEPDAAEFLSKLLLADNVWISPINWWEVQVRMQSVYGDAGEKTTSLWMAELGIKVDSVSIRHAELALSAYARYRGRPAKLNLGDCFAYGLAQARGVPLLFKGNDFNRTDVRPA